MQRKGRINWLAVLAGNVLDNVLSAIIFSIGLGFDPNVQLDGFFSSTTGVVVGLLLLLATVAGGFLAGWIAKEERFLHGFLVGGIGIIILMLIGWLGQAPRLDEIVLQCLATLLAGLAGYSSRWTPARQRGK